jgi:hypothetical protein
MRRIIFAFDGLSLAATLRDTPTADAVWKALPFEARVMTWGEEVYFATPVSVPREKDAKSIVTPGEIAFWTDGDAIALDYGPTPVSKGDEIRLASPANFFADTTEDVRALAKVRSGSRVRVEVG